MRSLMAARPKHRLLVVLASLAVGSASTSFALADRGRGHGRDDERARATLALFRAVCGTVHQSTRRVGLVRARAETDNRGPGTDNGIRSRARILVAKGVPNTSYRVFVLRATAPGACEVRFRGGVLRTNNAGVGSARLDVRNLDLPAGRFGFQLVAPAGATVPGPGPFADVLTTRLALVVPSFEEEDED